MSTTRIASRPVGRDPALRVIWPVAARGLGAALRMPSIALLAEGFPDTGFGTYWTSLYREFRKLGAADLVYLRHGAESPCGAIGIEAVVIRGTTITKSRRVNRLILQTLGGAKVSQGLRPWPVVHLTSDVLSFLLPSLRTNKTIVTCHDLYTFLRTRAKLYDVGASLPRNIRNLANQQSIRHLASADHVISVSQSTKRDLIEHLGIPDDRITVVYNGVDHARYQPANQRAARDLLGLAYDKFIVLNVGSENVRKNILTLLRAAKRLADARHDVILLRIGRPSRQSLDFIRKHNLEDVVRYLPKVADLAPYYHAADAYVSASIYEGFGLTIAEAMASGCPIIAANRSAVPEVVGAAGILIDDAFEAAAYAAALKKLYVSKATRDSLSSAAIVQAGRFTWEKSATETQEVYARLD